MSNKSTLLRAFNTHFFDFIKDLLLVLPSNEELIYAKNAFDSIKRANPTAIIKVWYKYIFLPYQDIILNSDNISFFINKDYSEDLSVVSNSKEIMSMIDNIRLPIAQMDEKNKKHALKYLQNLCKLSMLHHDSV